MNAMKNIQRRYVARKVAPFVTSEVLKSLRKDLRDRNWQEGTGQWDSSRASVKQVSEDRFDVEINSD